MQLRCSLRPSEAPQSHYQSSPAQQPPSQRSSNLQTNRRRRESALFPRGQSRLGMLRSPPGCANAAPGTARRGLAAAETRGSRARRAHSHPVSLLIYLTNYQTFVTPAGETHAGGRPGPEQHGHPASRHPAADRIARGRGALRSPTRNPVSDRPPRHRGPADLFPAATATRRPGPGAPQPACALSWEGARPPSPAVRAISLPRNRRRAESGGRRGGPRIAPRWRCPALCRGPRSGVAPALRRAWAVTCRARPGGGRRRRRTPTLPPAFPRHRLTHPSARQPRC